MGTSDVIVVAVAKFYGGIAQRKRSAFVIKRSRVQLCRMEKHKHEHLFIEPAVLNSTMPAHSENKLKNLRYEQKHFSNLSLWVQERKLFREKIE